MDDPTTSFLPVTSQDANILITENIDHYDMDKFLAIPIETHNTANSRPSDYLKKVNIKYAEKSRPHAVARICQFAVNKIQLKNEFIKNCADSNGTFAFVIALKMKRTRRSVKSREIIVNIKENLDLHCDVLITFAYWHMIKFTSGLSTLEVFLQQKNRYIKRRVFGYKNIAIGTICMDTLLQKGKSTMSLKMLPFFKESCDLFSILHIKVCTKPYNKSLLKSHLNNYVNDNGMTEDMPFDTEEEIVEYVHSDGSESENEIGKSTSGKHRLKQKFILLIKKIKNTGNSTDEGVINLIHRQKRLEGYEIEKYLNNENTEFYDSNEVYDNSSLDSYVSESLTVIRPQLKPFFSNLTVNSSNSIRTESDTHKIKDIKEKYNLNGKLRRSNSIDLNKITRGNAEKLRPTLSCNDNLPSKCITSGRPDSDGWNNFDISNEEIYLKKSGTYEKEINLPTSTISEIVDMINSILHGKEITETFILIDMNNYTETMLSLLKKKFNCVLICKSYLAVSIFMQNMLDSIDKFCAINAHRPVILQILIYGDDAFVSWILRSYVLQSQNRKSQNDWTNFLRFLFIPASANSDFATYLSSIDAKYNFNFNDDMWKSTFLDNKLLLNVDGSSNCPLMNKKSLNCKSLDLISSRIESYIKTARSTCYLQIAEVMFNDFNSNHVFVPFINRVNIGNNTSSDCRNSANGNSQVSSKIKQFPKKKLSNNVCSKRNSTGAKDLKCLNVQNIYPPLRDSNFLSPSDAPSWQCNDTSTTSDQYPSTSFISSNSNTHIDLQIDYWMSMLTSLPRPSSFEIKQYRRDSQTQSKNKISLKSCIYASVKRLPENSILPNLNIISVNCLFLKRKKNNIINRISKKSISKDGRMREQSIVHCQNGVSRVICSSKYPNQYITLDIDGHEWKALSFFQVAAQWKGHTKYFPITMFGYSS